jgi:hypothetical protein
LFLKTLKTSPYGFLGMIKGMPTGLSNSTTGVDTLDDLNAREYDPTTGSFFGQAALTGSNPNNPTTYNPYPYNLENPATGSFFGQDQLTGSNLGNPITDNPYQYGLDNPMSYEDPSGLCSLISLSSSSCAGDAFHALSEGTAYTLEAPSAALFGGFDQSGEEFANACSWLPICSGAEYYTQTQRSASNSFNMGTMLKYGLFSQEGYNHPETYLGTLAFAGCTWETGGGCLALAGLGEGSSAIHTFSTSHHIGRDLVVDSVQFGLDAGGGSILQESAEKGLGEGSEITAERKSLQSNPAAKIFVRSSLQSAQASSIGLGYVNSTNEK